MDVIIASQRNLLWQRVILYSEINLLVPVEALLYLALYTTDGKETPAAKELLLQVVVPITRVTAMFVALVLGMYLGVGHLATRVFLIAAAAAFLVEINYTSSSLFRSETASRIMFLVAACMPINFVNNLVADRSTPLANVLAIAQTAVRAVALLIIVSSAIIKDSYMRAWSCYTTDDVTTFVNGPCPLYTHDFSGNNLACVNNLNPACQGIISKHWRQPPIAVHHAGVIVGALYGFHALNVRIAYPLVKD